jgi:hypothetical protein
MAATIVFGDSLETHFLRPFVRWIALARDQKAPAGEIADFHGCSNSM